VLKSALQLIHSELKKAGIDVGEARLVSQSHISEYNETSKNHQEMPVDSPGFHQISPYSHPNVLMSPSSSTTISDHLDIKDLDFTPEMLASFSQIEPMTANAGGGVNHPMMGWTFLGPPLQ
jgi:hypothetical protein